ncbi:MAG: PorP/SprF family type IX secretion system membrane protein [Bacteroidales bacterium]|jgi:type IX secretion system PorP/SprF family membrane protein|nr:PorP/SprF family type IX secretion system membrane protein [Bacteroidales bacterium]
MRYPFSIILLVMMSSVVGQDLPDLTNYQHNWIIFNPAFTGSRDVRSWSVFSKDNAISDPGIHAPKYFQLAMHTPFKNSEKNAWGFSYFNEKEPGIGLLGLNFSDPVPMVNHNLSGYYAHKVKIGSGQLSLGLSGIVSNERVDNSGIVARQSADPIFLVDIEPVWNLNFGAVALYYNNNLFVAASVPRLLPPISIIDNNPQIEALDTISNPLKAGGVYLDYNYMLASGYQFEISENFTIYPSFLAGYIPSTGLININYMASLNFGFVNEMVWIGAIYKSANEISVNFNVELFDSEVLIGFSWDFPLSNVSGYFDNAFELILRWDNLTKVVTKAPFYF